MTKELSTKILDDAKECFKGARQNLIQGAGLLYTIKKDNLWATHYDSFSQFLESECEISDGFASKLIQVWEGYVVEGGFSQRKIEEVDHEKLYLALKLLGSVEKKLTSAETLTRGELKESVREETNPCNHEGEEYKLLKRYACGKWEQQ